MDLVQQPRVGAGRPPTGHIRERRLKDGGTSYIARFTAYGERVDMRLGRTPDWNRARAEVELANIAADVRRGLWRHPSEVAPVARAPLVPADPELQVVASEFVASALAGKDPNTENDLLWRVQKHLLPFFAVYLDGSRRGQARHFSELDDALVDRYIAFKLAERRDMANVRALIAAGTPAHELSRRYQRLAQRYGRSSKGLSNTSINATLASLRAMIDFGLRRYRGVLDDNPAAGKSVPDETPDRSFLEVHTFAAVLDAAAELDEQRARYRIGRLPAVATLGLAGPRVGELTALRLRDVDLQTTRLYIADAKTAAGVRHVNIVPKLAETLEPWWHHRQRAADGNLDALMWPTDGGKTRDGNSVRNRLLRDTIRRARALLSERDELPMPDRVTPHTFRRTYATYLAMNGETARYTMGQIGHRSAALTLELYEQVSAFRGVPDPRLRQWLGSGGA